MRRRHHTKASTSIVSTRMHTLPYLRVTEHERSELLFRRINLEQREIDIRRGAHARRIVSLAVVERDRLHTAPTNYMIVRDDVARIIPNDTRPET